VPDDWAYRDSNNPLGNTFGTNNLLARMFGGEPYVILIPTEFHNMLVNSSQQFTGKAVEKGGAYSLFSIDNAYPYKNVPLETYTQYNIELSPVKIFSQENATIAGEEAVRILKTPRDNATNVHVLDYYTVHNGKPYFIQYVAHMKNFEKYLPEFEQMVKTLKFVK
jgi:hypothetical protein